MILQIYNLGVEVDETNFPFNTFNKPLNYVQCISQTTAL